MSEAQNQNFRVSSSISATAMPDGAVLMDTATGECFELNRIGARLWDSLARGEKLDSVVDAIASDHSVQRSIVSADAAKLIAELTRRGILVALP